MPCPCERDAYPWPKRLARQAISLDPNFAAAYGLILDCYINLRDQGWVTSDDIAAQAKQYAAETKILSY
jgi:hypothetical protein